MNGHVAASASADGFVPSPRRFIRAIRMRHIIHRERRNEWMQSKRNTYGTRLNSCKKFSWGRLMNKDLWKPSPHYNTN